MYNEDYFNKENFIEKLNYAVEFRFETYRAFYKAFNDKYTSFDISQAVRSWRSFSKNNANRLPSINQLIQLCNVLDCDMDYFITDQKELRKDIASASEITGLNYENIEKIVNLKYTEVQTLNIFISHKNFAPLLHQINRYLRLDCMQNIDNFMLEKGMEFDVTLLRQQDKIPTKAINKFYIADGISMIVEDLDKNYYNIEKQGDFERALIDEIMEISSGREENARCLFPSLKTRFDVCQELLGRINPTSIYATLSMDELKNKK